MIRFTCLSRNAWTAAATARYVLPVPAGPTPIVMVFFKTEAIYPLSDGLGFDGTTLGGDAQHVAGQFRDLLLLARTHQVHHIPHILFP